MFELFKAEFLRTRNKAIGLFVLQLVGWQIVAQFKPLLQASPLQTAGYHVPIMFASFAFGFMQMRLYTTKSFWTFLLQRPLNNTKIFIALATAALLNLLIAVPTAWLLMVAGLDTFTNVVVDTRHYQHALFVIFVAFSSYLIGTFVRLNASRGAILVGLGLIFSNEVTNASFGIVIVRILLILLILLYLNIRSFKPDLSQKISSPIANTLMAVPMQLMIVVMLFLLTGPLYHLPNFMLGAHPNQHPVDGSYEYWRSQPKESRLSMLLNYSDKENLNWLARQSELAEQYRIDLDIQAFTEQGVLYIYDKQYGLTQKEGEHLWVFSHDKMLIKGVNTRTDTIIGWLGQRGFIDTLKQVRKEDRFQSVPFLVGSNLILTENSMLHVNFIDKLLALKFQLDNDEHFVSQPQSSKHYVSIVSNKSTYLFEPQNFYQDLVLSEPDYIVTHPVSLEKISFIDTYRMVDGFLLNYIGTGFEKFDRSGLKLVYARTGRDNEVVYSTEFKSPKYPALIQHFHYTVSPVVYALNESFFHVYVNPSDYKTIAEIWQWKMPTVVNITIVLLQLLSAIIVFIFSRRLNMKVKQTLLWVVMAMITGIPGLICFFFLNDTKAIPQEVNDCAQ